MEYFRSPLTLQISHTTFQPVWTSIRLGNWAPREDEGELTVILWPQLRNLKTSLMIYSTGPGKLQAQSRFKVPDFWRWEKHPHREIEGLWMVTFADQLPKHPTFAILQLQLVVNRKKSQYHFYKEGPFKAFKILSFLSRPIWSFSKTEKRKKKHNWPLLG